MVEVSIVYGYQALIAVETHAVLLFEDRDEIRICVATWSFVFTRPISMTVSNLDFRVKALILRR